MRARGTALSCRAQAPLGHRAQRLVHRLRKIVGQLDGETPAVVTQLRDQTRKQRAMVRHPVQHGIGQYHVRRLRQTVGPHVRLDEARVWHAPAGGSEHIGRAVDADHIGFGITGRQNFGGIAGPASQIDDAARGFQRDLRNEVTGWTGAFVLERQIKPRTPFRDHGRPPAVGMPTARRVTRHAQSCGAWENARRGVSGGAASTREFFVLNPLRNR